MSNDALIAILNKKTDDYKPVQMRCERLTANMDIMELLHIKIDNSKLIDTSMTDKNI